MPLIVILDDQETNRRIFERLASSIESDMVIRVFGDPSSALKEFDQGLVPDLIVTDYKMPVMDGEGFIRALRVLPVFQKFPSLLSLSTKSAASVCARLKRVPPISFKAPLTIRNS